MCSDFRPLERRCCTSLTTEDSFRESMQLQELHQQAITRPLLHHQLVQLQCIAQEAAVFADLGALGSASWTLKAISHSWLEGYMSCRSF